MGLWNACLKACRLNRRIVNAVHYYTFEEEFDYNDKPTLRNATTLLAKFRLFFGHYKDFEKGKWVKLQGWGNVDKAREEIISLIQAYPAH